MNSRYLELCAKAALWVFFISITFSSIAKAEEETCPGGIEPVTTGRNCSCVDVNADCIITDPRQEYDDIRGDKCGALNVEADEDGKFPEVQVRFSYSMCNYNPLDLQLTDKAKFYDWARKAGDKQKNVDDPRYPLDGLIIRSGQCIEKTDTFYIDTSYRYNIATHLQGVVLDENGVPKDPKTDYCYAYYSKPINIKRGLCKMNTSVSCKIFNTNIDCQEFIDRHVQCIPFDAEIKWEACNLEPRRMKIFPTSSNIKIAKKVNGKTVNEKIAQVRNPLGPFGDGTNSNCQEFGPQIRRYNTCEALPTRIFFSINVQGAKPNGKYWYECQDFSFSNLIFNPTPILPMNTTIAPSSVALVTANNTSTAGTSTAHAPSSAPSRLISPPPVSKPKSAENGHRRLRALALR